MVNISSYNSQRQKLFGILDKFSVQREPETKKNLENCCCPQIFAGESVFTGQGSGVKPPGKMVCTFKTNRYPATLPSKSPASWSSHQTGVLPACAQAADGMTNLLAFVVHCHKVVLTGFVSGVNSSSPSQIRLSSEIFNLHILAQENLIVSNLQKMTQATPCERMSGTQTCHRNSGS